MGAPAQVLDQPELGSQGTPSGWSSVDRSSRIAFGTTAVAAFVITAIWLQVQHEPIWDDPYIFFRFARNIANGDGWTFNPGQPAVNATSSVTNTFVLAIGEWLGVSAPRASTIVWLVCLPLGAAVIGFLLTEAGYALAGILTTLTLVILPSFTIQRGMESALLVLAIAAVLLFARFRRPYALGLAIGLLVLTRPDAVVIVIGLALIDLRTPRPEASPLVQHPWKVLSTALAVIAPWIVYAQVELGRIIPTTFAAKRAQFESGQWPSFAKVFFSQPFQFETPFVSGLLLVFAAVGIAAIFSRSSVTRIGGPLVIAAVLQLLTFSLLQPVPMYPWYSVMICLATVVAAAIGIELAIRAVAANLNGIALGGVLAAFVVTYGFARLDTEPSPVRESMKDAGGWIAQNTSPDATVASQEIGIIGWFSNRTVVDYLGLLDPKRNAEIRRGDFVSWLHATQPDYWAVSKFTELAFVDYEARTKPRFASAFEVAVVLDDAAVLKRVKSVPSRSTP